MSDTLVASILSITGIVMSVIISVIVARIQNNAALEKIKKELEQQYARSLFEQRISLYPALYKLLSGYGKLILYKKNNTKNLKEFRDEVDEWNSRHSLFFSIDTTRISFRFRRFLNELQLSSATPEITDSDWENIRIIINHFELSLKADIGVLDTLPAGVLKNRENIYAYFDEKVFPDIAKEFDGEHSL